MRINHVPITEPWDKDVFRLEETLVKQYGTEFIRIDELATGNLYGWIFMPAFGEFIRFEIAGSFALIYRAAIPLYAIQGHQFKWIQMFSGELPLAEGSPYIPFLASMFKHYKSFGG